MGKSFGHAYQDYTADDFAEEIMDNFLIADRDEIAWDDPQWGRWSAKMNRILRQRCEGGVETIPFLHAFGMWQAATQVLRLKKRKNLKLADIQVYRNTFKFCYGQVKYGPLQYLGSGVHSDGGAD